VVRPPAELINVNWLVAGLVAIFLLGAGLLLLRGGEDPATTGTLPENTTTSRNETTAGGAVQAPPVSNLAPVQGKAIGPMRPGQYPDFVGADLASSLSVLYDNGLNFLIIGVVSAETPPGLVMSQSPGPGAEADETSAITLVVSRAAGQ
jgi:hypothetical protein